MTDDTNRFVTVLQKGISKINQFRHRRPVKERRNVVLAKPAYFDRHKDRDFLILATGPTLNDCSEKIKAFAKRKNLIVIGVGDITSFMTPDYHGFCNRHRFLQFGATINPDRSRGLLSIYFTEDTIRRTCRAPFDFIMWRDLKDTAQCYTDEQGVVTHHGTSATLMIMVAYVMGARKIYVAGVEGNERYLSGRGALHYKPMPYKKHLSKGKIEAKYRRWPVIQGQALDAICRWAIENERFPFIFITPGRYDRYYQPEVLDEA